MLKSSGKLIKSGRWPYLSTVSLILLFSLLASELIVSGMSWWFFTALHYDYLITGLVTCLLVTTAILPLIFSLLSRLDRARDEQLQRDLLLNNLFKAIQDPIWVKDLNGTYLACNPAFESFYGANEASILGKTDYDFVDSEIADLFRVNDQIALTNDAPTKNEEWLTFQANGYRGLFETIKTPIKDETNQLIGVLGIARDITERKQMLEEIKRGEETLKQAQAVSQTGSWLLDITSNRLQYSQETSRIFGLAAGVSQTLETFRACIHPDDRKALTQAFLTCDKDVPNYESVYRVMAKGATLWVRECAYLTFSSDGIASSVIGTVQDITELKCTEISLREAQERLEFALQGASDGLWDWNLETNQVYYSPRWKSMLGYKEAELDNHFDTWKMLVHPDDMEVPLQLAADYLAGKITRYKAEFRMRHKEGRWIDVLSRAVLAQDKQGNPLSPKRLVGTHVDISLRKAIEDSLQRERMRLTATLENTPNVAVQWFDRQGRVKYWNAASERFYGFTAAEVLGKTLEGVIFTREQTVVFLEAVKDICQRGIPMGPSVYQTQTRNGGICYIEATLFKIPDDTGEPMVACMDVDITARQLAENALKDSELRFRRLFEDSSQATLILENNHFIDCNRAAINLLMFTSPEQIRGVSPCSISPELQPDGEPSEQKAAAMIVKAYQQGSHMFEWEHFKADGTPFLVEVLLTPIQFENRNLLHVIWRDITEHKRLEAQQKRLQAQLQQAQKMEAIGQLTGGIAHDFNNILAAIMGYTGLALDRFVPDKESKLAEYLQEVYKAGERARDLIAKMLAFSRAQSGARPKPIQLQAVVSDVLKMLTPTLPSSIQVSYAVQTDTRPILMDEVAIQQMLTNLIINGRDAVGDQGHIEVKLSNVELPRSECSACHAEFMGAYVELQVSDNGHGIPEAILHRVFDPFFTTKETGKGTGMGLSVVHGLTHTYQGHLMVQSSAEQGTRFRLLFPVAEAETETKSKTNAVSDPTAADSHANIMIVDDEQALVNLWDALLTDNGYKTSIFTDSLKALAAFQADPSAFDAIITDQTMPNMGGDALATALLAIRPELPIILCTGYSDRMDSVSAQQLGVQRFFHKPVPTHELLIALRELLTTGD